MIDIKSLIDVKQGLQSRKIFFDRDVYELESKQIFARCWQFLTHECLIPNVGDFTSALMGEDEVIVARQRDGSVKAFLNACRHRGAQVCAAEAGNARSFVCNFHGWAYGLDGSLQSVPLEQEAYKGRLNKAALGLTPVAKVESYRGFIFGCFDPEAPSLVDYLGDVRWYMDIWMEATGGVELVGPPARSVLHCNWKTPAEGFVGDAYHPGWTHAASFKVIGGVGAQLMGNAALPKEGPGMQVTTRHGHGMAILYGLAFASHPRLLPELLAWQAKKKIEVEKKLGPLAAKLYQSHHNATIFPNCSYLWGTNIFKVWAPRGPNAIEVFSWWVVEKDMPDDLKEKLARSANFTFGTAGILESDDSDNMETTAQLGRGYMTRHEMLNSQMGMGDEHESPEAPGIVANVAIGETSYRGFYKFYREIMEAKSWADIRAKNDSWKQDLLSTVR